MDVQSFDIAPFDMLTYNSVEGVQTLQARLSGWLRTLSGPARFLCWQFPADLNTKIGQLSQACQQAAGHRAALLDAYRRSYETLHQQATYHRTRCGMLLWSADNPQALAGGMTSAFETTVSQADLPPLFQGQYQLRDQPLWHLAPVGRPGGRPVWTVLSSYELLPVTWNFFEPVARLLKLGFPMAICVDIPRTYDRHTATEKLEAMILAYQTHLATASGEDSRAVRRVQDCYQTLQDLNDGDALHDIQIMVALPAYDTRILKQRVAQVENDIRPWLRLRPEIGELLSRTIQVFSPQSTRELHLPDNTWPLTSRIAALCLGPLGARKLSHTDGVLRGEAVGGAYPVFYQSWRAHKHASHEVWVGLTGSGKTFALNCLLTREYAELGTPFDLLEPMGHGRLTAEAVGVEWLALDQATCLNPQDVMFPTLLEQISHTIRIYEAVMGRQLAGNQAANLERGLLSHALDTAYAPWPVLERIPTENTPTCSRIVDILSTLGDQPQIRELARNLADEIAALCTGYGPWAHFLDGETTLDMGRHERQTIGPRVISFQALAGDPVMIALAYTQVLSAIRRDSLHDEQPRIIAVDEVYRLMRHPSLLDFLIEAAKTFRTKRKKLITIDQNMSVFLDGKARLIFENSPLRVIFNQRQGMHIFREDPAFDHMNDQHLRLIAALPAYHFLFDVQEEGTWCLFNRPMAVEYQLFAHS